MIHLRLQSYRLKTAVQLFVAKHPVTKPNINIIRRSEENLAEKIDELFETAINTVETIVVKP